MWETGGGPFTKESCVLSEGVIAHKVGASPPGVAFYGGFVDCT